VQRSTVTREEIAKAFREKAKTLRCPHCDTLYTDAAVDWCDAWLEGRQDTLDELRLAERDGPIKFKCELCNGTAWSNAFLVPPTPADRGSDIS
jgi:uncharacterized C2H2 Zn-finger protein